MRRASSIFAVVAAVVSIAGCAAFRTRPSPTDTELGRERAFAGTIVRHGPIRGGRRFSATVQGFWFRLRRDPATYRCFVNGVGECAVFIEAGTAGGDASFRDVDGRRVAGQARVIGDRSLEVSELRWEAP